LLELRPTEFGRRNNRHGRGEKQNERDETHNHVTTFTPNDDMRNEFLEKLLRRKQRYLLTAFLNQAAYPMQYACLGLFLAGRTRGIKLIVKRNISRGGRYSKIRMGMRWTLKLHVRAWM
jgi:hypothetical protein